MSRYSDLVLADSPVAYWRLGEASGTNANDEIGTADGTYGNTPTLGVTGLLVGDSNTAVTFARASSEAVNISSNMPAGSTTGASVEMWVNIPAITVNAQTWTLWSQGSTAAAHHMLQYQAYVYGDPTPSDYLIHWSFWDGARRDQYIYFTGSNVLGGGPHHLVLAHDYAAKTFKVYIDSVLAGTKNLSAFGTPGQLAAGLSSRIAGYMGNDASMASGTFDEVATYSTALSSTRVTAHYNAGITSFRNQAVVIV